MRHNCPRCLSDIDLSLSLSLQKAMMDAQNALKKKKKSSQINGWHQGASVIFYRQPTNKSKNTHIKMLTIIRTALWIRYQTL